MQNQTESPTTQAPKPTAIATDNQAAPAATPLQRYVPLLCWAIVVLTFLLLMLKVMGTGYLPGGDARRHVAKVFTERPYTDIVVMRPEYTMDHSPGWEWVLRALHRQTGWSVDGMMGF